MLRLWQKSKSEVGEMVRGCPDVGLNEKEDERKIVKKSSRFDVRAGQIMCK